MLTQRFIAAFVPVLLLLMQSSGSWAQKHEIAGAKLDKLFDALMRKGDLPFEFKVNVYRMDGTAPGKFAGTVSVRNTLIMGAEHEEAALWLKAELTGLAPGVHAIRIYRDAGCVPPEKDGATVPGPAAGSRLSGHNARVERVAYKSRAGDLPGLRAGPDGTANEAIVAPRVTLADLVNRSIVIHASDGDSSREACGVLR